MVAGKVYISIFALPVDAWKKVVLVGCLKFISISKCVGPSLDNTGIVLGCLQQVCGLD